MTSVDISICCHEYHNISLKQSYTNLTFNSAFRGYYMFILFGTMQLQIYIDTLMKHIHNIQITLYLYIVS
jgi:hypothetical protein